MTEEDMAFWEEIDKRILDIIDLIRLKYTKFNETPIQKVVYSLRQAFIESGKVCDAIDKGWL
jgi:hypothetical protein